jgi:translation initiation factor IF-2
MGKKVFELAKELDEKPLDLVEKLKNLGLNVRNHMSTLSDEDLAVFNHHLEAKQIAADAVKPKKTIKKKAPIKKVVEAKTAKSAKVDTVKSTEELKSQAKAKKKVDVLPTAVAAAGESSVVRKKTVIRRRQDGPSSEELSPLEVDDFESEELELRGSEKSVASDASREPVLAKNTKVSTSKNTETGLYQFNPVFIPEKVVPKKVGEEGYVAEVDEDDDELKKDGVARKRLGDLAQMVAKPKVVNKSRDIVEMRSQEQLKNLAGIVGKAIFTNVGKKKVFNGATKRTMLTEARDIKRIVYFDGGCTVKELANELKQSFETFRNKALELNLLLNEDDYLGIHLANQLAELYKYKVEDKAFDESEILNRFESDDEDDHEVNEDNEDNEKGEKKTNDVSKKSLKPQTKSQNNDKNAKPRNPIIAIMGHVDHGKTTLVDYIRKTKVVDSEAGGITQHIGAYSVPVKNGLLTFLDTPGHAAFASMRMRGAKVTDLVVLVVAADDGVMPQTKESIRFCKEAGVPIIVAINKIDKEGANPDQIKQQLMEFELVSEEWGGQTMFMPISALKGKGIDELLESIHLQTEMMELKANPKGAAEGIVIESKIEVGRGAVATIIVQSGTLNKGDFLVVGECMGRARSLMDYSGKLLAEAGPSMPVEILGLDSAPQPGDKLNVVKNEREAKKIVENRINERKLDEASSMRKLEDFSTNTQNKILKLIVRTDVQGSFEAIKNSLENLGNSEVQVQIIGGGVGAISDSDVILAKAAEGFIIGFNMRPVTSARKLAEEKGVDVKTYSIIYELINDITLALEGMLTPDRVETYIGRAMVKDTFNIPKIGVIAGSQVVDGKIKFGCSIRLLRDGKIVFDGKMSTLKRFKDSVKEVANGLECGIALENYSDIKVNDIFEAYLIEEKERKLQSDAVM